MGKRPPPAVMHPPAAIWLRLGVLGELRRRPLPPAVVRRSAVGVAVGVLTVGRGVAPQLWTAHPWGPSQNIPIRASKGMTCPDLGEIVGTSCSTPL